MSERHDHAKNLIGKVRIELCGKSFILQMYDVLARHYSARFGVVISLIEVAQLTKASRSTPEMYSVAMKMFLPSAIAAE
jgi:type IV secretory pathway TrbD component